MMKAIKYLVLIIIGGVRVVHSQPGTVTDKSSVYSRVREQANAMGQAFLRGDYDTFAGYLYPVIINSMGGKEQIAATLRKTVSNLKANGASFSNITVDNPSKIIKAHSELQCTLQQHTTIKTRDSKIVTTSTLIAMSENGGKDWFFIDTSNKAEKDIRKALPNLNQAIVIPPQRKPVVYKL
ncbi:hypothetical protein [Mucilaginibacter sp. L3T2-6]|uniref:hypothetical protein n=1 Tax=Mucilaginibacter sp. L3T2-6 TaxID=3062491 RepID=UPI0026769A73|nr:hypothetical protein [Mucilaginibacter sp. L3T2-6]MDO3645239.1 hypothetical protein [Mucilaginibacter sp. L3T2-6]MDV6217691.1 hypothetical protein [Mucilaginibacter sp. L3T2-6]